MGALAKSIKENKIGHLFSEVFEALKSMVNLAGEVEEELSLEEAIKITQAENPGSQQEIKDLEYKLAGIEATVSEEKALTQKEQSQEKPKAQERIRGDEN